jgi:hypothetical protein
MKLPWPSRQPVLFVTSKFLLTVDEVIHFEVKEGTGCSAIHATLFFSTFFPPLES